MFRWLVVAIGLSAAASPVFAADPIEIGIGYLGRAGVKAKLSLVELPAENDGFAGARLARQLAQVLRDLQDAPYEEVAQTLDIPVGTVKSRLHRARRALKELLAPHYCPKRKAS